MAERRMFAKSVINSARFLRMSQAARLLYYDLGMAADDDGYAEAFTVLRTTGADERALDELVDRGFIRVVNDDLVAYIVEWNTNNQIRKDRYHPSIYKGTETNGLPMVDQRETEYRLGKERIVKSSLGECIGPTLNEIEDFVIQEGLTLDTRRFFNHYSAQGWKTSAGAVITDWKPLARKWAAEDAEKSNAPAPRDETATMSQIKALRRKINGGGADDGQTVTA